MQLDAANQPIMHANLYYQQQLCFIPQSHGADSNHSPALLLIHHACFQHDYSRGNANSYRRHASQANACTNNNTRQQQQPNRNSLGGLPTNNVKIAPNELQQQR
jgi:hypothetical protein